MEPPHILFVSFVIFLIILMKHMRDMSIVDWFDVFLL
jgi:hypothetical protein